MSQVGMQPWADLEHGYKRSEKQTWKKRQRFFGRLGTSAQLAPRNVVRFCGMHPRGVSAPPTRSPRSNAVFHPAPAKAKGRRRCSPT